MSVARDLLVSAKFTRISCRLKPNRSFRSCNKAAATYLLSHSTRRSPLITSGYHLLSSTTLTGHRSHRHIPCDTRMDWLKRIPKEKKTHNSICTNISLPQFKHIVISFFSVCNFISVFTLHTHKSIDFPSVFFLLLLLLLYVNIITDPMCMFRGGGRTILSLPVFRLFNDVNSCVDLFSSYKVSKKYFTLSFVFVRFCFFFPLLSLHRKWKN